MLYFIVADNLIFSPSYYWGEGRRGKVKACTRDLSVMSFLNFQKTSSKLTIQKTRIMASGPITSWQIDGEKVETVTHFIFLGSKIIEDGDCSTDIFND